MPMSDRPTWDEYMMRICEVVSTRSTCNRASVGVVVTDEDHHILATGYNGAPSGLPHCPHDESLVLEEHCEYSSHAEQNAVAHAAKLGVSLNGAIWYLHPFGPCQSCQRLIIASGGSRVVSPRYREDFNQLANAKITVGYPDRDFRLIS